MVGTDWAAVDGGCRLVSWRVPCALSFLSDWLFRVTVVSPRRKQEHRAKIRMGPSPDNVHAVVYFKRHPDDDPSESIPGREFLGKVCPPAVRATMRAALAAVASAPPKRFAGGGYWEAMSGEMTGWYEVRKDGPKRHHYRLFCLLDYEAQGQEAAAGSRRRPRQAL